LFDLFDNFFDVLIIYDRKRLINLIVGIGDWGLGIGDWGLGPIPNPQSPIPSLIN